MNSRGRGEEGVDDIRPDNLLVINLDFHTANPVDGGVVSLVLFHRSIDQQADGFRGDVPKNRKPPGCYYCAYALYLKVLYGKASLLHWKSAVAV